MFLPVVNGQESYDGFAGWDEVSIQIPVVAFQWHGGNQPGVIPNKACERLRVYGPNEGNTVKHTCGWSFNTSPTGGISLAGICWHHNPEDGKYARYLFVVFKFDRWKTLDSLETDGLQSQVDNPLRS
jgi:hypothetical protein